jgi:hypothetical protein
MLLVALFHFVLRGPENQAKRQACRQRFVVNRRISSLDNVLGMKKEKELKHYQHVSPTVVHPEILIKVAIEEKD